MGNWSLPTLGSQYSNFITEIDSRLDDSALMLDPAFTTVTNMPTNSVRWTSASNKWQKYNGTSWVDLTATYAINVSTANAWATARNLVIGGDGAATFSNVSGSSNVTASLVLATVNSSAGTFGSNSAVPVISVDGKGRITSVTTSPIGSMALQTATSVAITGGSISGVNLTLLNGTGSTVEGRMVWNFTSDLLTVGTGSGTKTMVDTNSTQTISGKTLSSPTISTPILSLALGANPTGLGLIEWDSTNFLLRVGTGSGNRTMVDTTTTQTLTNKTLTAPSISTINNAGTVTIPTGTNTLATVSSAQTLTNKVINASQLVNNSVTYAKIQQVGAQKLLGNAGTATATVSEVGLSNGLAIVGSNIELSQGSISEDTAPDVANDFVYAYDASAGTNKKVKMNKVGNVISPLNSQGAGGLSAIDFNIPSSARRITVILDQLSVTSANNVGIVLRIFYSGTELTSGYNTGFWAPSGVGSAGSDPYVLLMPAFVGGGGQQIAGKVEMDKFTNVRWAYEGKIVPATGSSNTNCARVIAGTIPFPSGTLDNIRITTTDGSTFDGGSVVVFYE